MENYNELNLLILQHLIWIDWSKLVFENDQLLVAIQL